ncbi:MAG TPA: DnaJ domain-containing protein [Candidatus Limnocylindrales bacterium]|nr:DnaJ domain-containing protein [Candidatus Limnocylindrales bacterium]
MSPERDPYKVLQVDPEAEDEVIQAAYRRLAQKYHPDRQPGPDGATRMIAINAAWELVGDPAKRAAYDRSRASGQAGPAAAAPSAYPSPASPPRPAPPSPRPASGPATGGSTGQRPPGPETVSRDWTSGRSGAGGGYDATTMRKAEGEGAAGPPPGNPSGSVLKFGRYAGWSIGEIARRDLEYLEWLDRMAIGRQYRDEIDIALRRAGRRRSAAADAADQRGLFRRR